MKLFRLCGTCVCFSDLSPEFEPEFEFEFDLNSFFMSRGTTNGPIDMGQRSWVPLENPLEKKKPPSYVERFDVELTKA